MKNLCKLKGQLFMIYLLFFASSLYAQQTKSDTIKRVVVIEVDTVVKGAKQKVSSEKPVEVVTVVNRQEKYSSNVFERGTLLVDGGIVYQDNLLPVMFAGEFGLGKRFGLEARTWYGNKTKDGVKYEDGFLGVGLNYHFVNRTENGKASKLDSYFGALYGKILDDSGSAFYLQAGGRYFLFRSLGAFANLNLGIAGKRGANLSFGLSYRID
jgi:hypothetical protein